LIGIANALYDMGDAEQAIHYYERVIEIDEEIADVYYNLANAQYLLNNINDAVNNYQKALEINPKKVECYYNLGNAFCN
jgi:tetratricopeptide (TPR) repeat protein